MIPHKLLKQGVLDMLRISDARMSGTSYGACILHVVPEAYVGGTLSLVRDGDNIAMDIPARTLHREVSDREFPDRRANWIAPTPSQWKGLRMDVQRAHHPAKRGLRLRLLEVELWCNGGRV